MFITGYSAPSKKPCIVNCVETRTGMFGKNGEPMDATRVTRVRPVVVPEGHWVMITHENNLSIYPLKDELHHKQKIALEAVKSADSLDGEARIERLSNAAEILGIDVHELFSKLRSVSNPGENLVDVYERIKNKQNK